MNAWLLSALVSSIVLFVVMTCVAYLTWLERKVAARFQNRIGPFFVGYPHGWLQPLADVVKLIVKEDITPRAVDRVLFNLAPLLVIAPALIGFAFIPFLGGTAVVVHPLSFLFFLAFASLSLLGVFAAGWSSNNKYALISALRMVALLVSYEIPLLLSLLVPALLVGSFDLVRIVEAQRGLWFIAAPGVGQVAFVVFFIAMLAESNKAPFDLTEAESELIAAYNVEYTGIKFALFYAGEYAHTFALAGLAATIFFGGYLGPALLPGPVWLLAKMFALFGLVLWVRWSLLRMRIDHALAFNWKILFPLSLVNLIAAGWWVVGRGPS
ncbi:MAG TPA: NADH-quinone oxidoreductase subunit NuoH [Candidatus Polarisedimenticolaceae bacterium]|nr:NADH-quinone oxidoreductase subunit NuoH [Candidatus Polarisedimenticolaceae bacterium]